MRTYRVVISDQTDDEGAEIHYTQNALNAFEAMLKIYARYHDMLQAKKITITEIEA